MHSLLQNQRRAPKTKVLAGRESEGIHQEERKPRTRKSPNNISPCHNPSRREHVHITFAFCNPGRSSETMTTLHQPYAPISIIDGHNDSKVFLFPTQVPASPPRMQTRKRQRVVRFDDVNVNYEGDSIDGTDRSKNDNGSTVATTVHPSSLPVLTPEISTNLWYHSSEIQEFKREVGTLLLRHAMMTSGKSPQVQNNNNNSNDDDALCGLERHNMARANAKKNAIRLVVQAQKLAPQPCGDSSLAAAVDNSLDKNLDERTNFLRAVSRKCSSRARNLALVQGLSDFCMAYDKQTHTLSPFLEKYSPQCISDAEAMSVTADAVQVCSTGTLSSTANDQHQIAARKRKGLEQPYDQSAAPCTPVAVHRHVRRRI